MGRSPSTAAGFSPTSLSGNGNLQSQVTGGQVTGSEERKREERKREERKRETKKSETGKNDPLTASRQQLVAGLQQKIHRLQSVNRVDDGSVIPGCCPEVNRLLPGGGYRRGTIIEWIVTDNSSSSPFSSGLSSQQKDAWQSGGYGVDYLSLLAAGRACNDGGALVVIDSERNFYPPAAVTAGIDLHNLIVLRPPSSHARLARPSGLPSPVSRSSDTPPDHNAFYWAIDQALKCPAVAAVWGPVTEIDERWFRRFQLSAESSGVTGMFIRPPAATGRPGWSEIQWEVEKQKGNGRPETGGLRNAQAETKQQGKSSGAVHLPARTSGHRFPASHSFSLNLRLARSRSGETGQKIQLEIDTITGRVHPVAGVQSDYERQLRKPEPVRQPRQTYPVSLAPRVAGPAADRRA